MNHVTLVIALLSLALLWLGPLPELARNSFAAHMLLHMLVVAVLAPWLAMGIAGGSLDPVRRAPGIFSPLPASALEFVVVWAWHTPALHHAARHSTFMMIGEQASYLAVGLLLWLSAFGGSVRDRRNRAAAGITGLLVTSMHMALLGVLLALAERPLFAHADPNAIGLSVLRDQQLGGIIMLVFGGTTYLIGALVLLARLLGDNRPDSRDGRHVVE